MADTIDWPARRPPQRRGRLFVFAVLAALVFGGGTALTFYVEALWFGSLGFGDVFWKTLNVQSVVFILFGAVTFAALYGSFLALKPANLGEIAGGAILINGQPVQLPVEPVLKSIALGLSVLIALATAGGMMAQWDTLALFWYAPDSGSDTVDPIFSRPLTFYLFTLPAWQLLAGWLMTLAVIACVTAIFFIVITGGDRLLSGRRDRGPASWRGVSVAFAALLATLALRVYLGRFERLFVDHTIFSGVTYTEAHVTLTGLLFVAIALAIGAGLALINAVAAPRLRWLVAAVAPAIACYLVVGILGWYVSSFIVKPNELVRERPYITHNIEMTRRAYGLDRIERVPFPAAPGIEALDVANNQTTLQNIRLWDWRALRDTLQQIQAIRTYYEFADVDIDRYEVEGRVRQMMLATRELSIDRLPESSRNWINERLIYTHGYGVTMNPANEFTAEGQPRLVLRDMPVTSALDNLAVTRPQIYFGELTNSDVYVNTGQQEFDYPQGENNTVTSYEGQGGIVLGGLMRRVLIALDRGDLAKLPFSDDVTASSRLLMRRNIRDRASALAPFLIFDDDPYIVLGDDGRLSWMMDAFTTSARYPYARHYVLERRRLNYMRNSVKVVIDAYDGTTTFYVFDTDDPIVNAYRRLFPSLFKDASEMPADLRRHVRYPELLLTVQAAVYGLYHVTNPEAFYNREDLWSVPSEAGSNDPRQQQAAAVEPNFVLMTLPGETDTEFVEILPFTPANRNNLIGWIAGRSDGDNYGKAVVYEFPEDRLVDGPLQIEARIDQDAQLSGQLSLWNQQGSKVLRGSLIVIPVGRGLLYAEPIYLQAIRSPMPELRVVVLALQDRFAYGPTFETALAALFGSRPSMLSPAAPSAAPSAAPPQPASGQPPGTPAPPADLNTLIADAARDLADYQRLTAEGKLGEAGQKLEALKNKLEQLAGQRR